VGEPIKSGGLIQIYGAGAVVPFKDGSNNCSNMIAFCVLFLLPEMPS
jgi:hypothetical protein